MIDKDKIELLAPAGDYEKLVIAVLYGADAVYIGGEEYGLRAKAKNFDIETMKKGIDFAHSHGVKVYVTANIYAHNDDFNGMAEYFKKIYSIGADALLVSDLGVFSVAKEAVPDMDIEAFVHGAMCISYSGRCLLSSYLTGRDANHGECAHPCRWKYYVVEETRPGEYMPVVENERGTYIYNSKDLCMINYIPELVSAGIRSFKIEGRMKTPFYVGTVVKAYRQAIDDYLSCPDKYNERKQNNYYINEVSKASHRDYTTGFYFGKPTSQDQVYTNNSYIREYDFVGIIDEDSGDDGYAVVMQRNKFETGDVVEVFPAKGESFKMEVGQIINEDGIAVESAPHPKELLKIKFSRPVHKYDMIRKEIK